MRLDKFLSDSGVLSRRECKTACSRGEISVDGITVKNSAFKVSESSFVAYRGKEIKYVENVYIMLNKPLGVVSATDDGNCPTVIDILGDELKKFNLFPCGRLDKDTTGLMIITTDGKSAHRRLAPKSHVEKVYEYTLAEDLKEGIEKELERGVTLKDGFKTAPCRIEKITPTFGKITLTEGKYHEVKRLFGYAGNKVTALNRISFGKIKLDDNLKRGEWRYLTEEEIEYFTE